MLVNKKAINALADLRVWLDCPEDIIEAVTIGVETDDFPTRHDALMAFEEEGETKIMTAVMTFANNVIDFDPITLVTLVNAISKDFHA